MPPSTPSFIPHPLTHPLTSLLLLFLLWKLLLLLLALSAPSPSYDTSTSLLYSSFTNPYPYAIPASPVPAGHTTPQAPRYISQLVRWDAIYMTEIARRGYLFEQDWAFSWGWSRLLRLCAAGLVHLHLAPPAHATATAGVLLAHATHLLSVLALYRLSRLLLPRGGETGTAWVAAALHVLAPAGVFLSAPYAEALFSLLAFAGAGLYAEGGDVGVVAAGVLWGGAAACRGNGLLWGIVFLVDAVEGVGGLLWGKGGGKGWWEELWGLGVTGVAGGCVGVGFVLPQVLAWREYCRGEEGEVLREWCEKRVPSIYAWVQSHYWDVGFLRYWTVSNLPLFLLAAPMLCVMTTSAVWGFTRRSGATVVESGSGMNKVDRTTEDEQSQQQDRARRVVLRLAIPQLVLAVMDLTTYHVQIITRLSSGYPVWYWWLASMMSENREIVVFGRKWQLAGVISRWMVVYAIVQGGLFVSFLPPA